MRSVKQGEDDCAVTVVIVNWNRRDCVMGLLDSLQSIDYGCVRVVVVDNASTDGSADVIKAHSLPVVLLENTENLGGTGGFNTGIRYALDNLDQKYIWLLDNDAAVTPVTLARMVDVMESDPRIGVVGSCIMSPENHLLIVEAGGFVDISNGTWRPHRRYEHHDPFKGRNVVEEVDYVPACSALIRRDVLETIGLLDERFFLHWDDIDFCTRARSAGFRVVATLDSLVFHGAEKGHSRMTLYYDFRNALLYFGKHTRHLTFLRSMMAILSRNLTSSIYYYATGRKQVAAYLYKGLDDFLNGRFGRVSISPGALAVEAGGDVVDLSSCLAGIKKVVVFAVGSYDEVVGAVRKLKEGAPRVSVSVAVASDRAQAYSLPEVDRLITFDLFRDGLSRQFVTAATVWGSRFTMGITAGNAFTVPYAFLLRRNLVFDGNSGEFRTSDISLSSVWKLPLAMLAGKLAALVFLLPVLWVRNKMRTNSRSAV